MDSQAFTAAVLRLQEESYEEIARLLGITREEAVEKVHKAAQPFLDSSRLMSRLTEFFTYTDSITYHEILCHKTCEGSYDTDFDHNAEEGSTDNWSIAYLVKTAQEHVCGDGKWKKD